MQYCDIYEVSEIVRPLALVLSFQLLFLQMLFFQLVLVSGGERAWALVLCKLWHPCDLEDKDYFFFSAQRFFCNIGMVAEGRVFWLFWVKSGRSGDVCG